MYNKQSIISSIDEFIETTQVKLSNDELQSLLNIRNKIKSSVNEDQILKWAGELLKFILLIKDIFHK